MTDAIKLKPCPFCGGGPSMDAEGSEADRFWVRCLECEQPYEQPTAADAASVWNTRADLHRAAICSEGGRDAVATIRNRGSREDV